MKIIRILLAILALSFIWMTPAVAQSGCSFIVYGAVLTAAQWNACFAAKNNTLGYTPVNKAGDTMSGKLNLTPSTTLSAGLSLGLGFSPNSPVNGDFWLNSSGINFQLGGLTIGPHNTPTYTGGSAPSSPTIYSFWNNTSGSTIPYNIYDGAQWVNIGTLNPSTHIWTAASGGSVTSFSAGSTGFTPSSATTGAITLAGTLNVGHGGTGLTAGTSGGIPYFNSASTLASSGLLSANALVIGGGAGAAPTTTTTAAGILTWLGTPSSANLAAALTDETGTGLAVFGTNPVLTTPNLGTPSAVNLANGTNLPATSLTGTIAAARMPALTGDVTTSAGAVATTIANNAVTNAKAAQMAAVTIKGNNTGSTANAADLTVSQVQTMLGVGAASQAGYKYGLTLSTAGSSAIFGITAGVATDSAAVQVMTLASAYTKTTAAWAVGTGNGCSDTGSTAILSKWYAVFIIERTDLTATDIICTPETAGTPPSPTMPSGYTFKRYIGSMLTNASVQWTGFYQTPNTNHFWWTVAPGNLFNGTPADTNPHLLVVTVPLGVQVTAHMGSLSNTANGGVYFWPPGAGSGAVPTYPQIGGNLPKGEAKVDTDTSGQVYWESDQITALVRINTNGWDDLSFVQ